jgi:DnaJ-class molecular chaperone
VVNSKDYYAVLGIDRGADPQLIKEAYRKLAFQFHPDRNRGDAASVEKMKEINEAYAVLSDEDKRSTYDSLHSQYGSRAYDHFRQDYSEQDIFRGSDIGQIFEEMAKTFGFRGFEDIFHESNGRTFQTRDFSGPGLFGRVIVFGPGSRAEPTMKSGNPTPGLMARATGWVTRYALKKIVGRLSGVQNVEYETITLDEDEANRGTKIAYLDEKRSRQLNISIPAGVKDGQLIRLQNVGGGRGKDGDLYLKVEIRRPLLKKVKELLKL